MLLIYFFYTIFKNTYGIWFDPQFYSAAWIKS